MFPPPILQALPQLPYFPITLIQVLKPPLLLFLCMFHHPWLPQLLLSLLQHLQLLLQLQPTTSPALADESPATPLVASPTATSSTADALSSASITTTIAHSAPFFIPANAHNMITRAKADISKAMVLLATIELTSYIADMKYARWLNAMNYEIDALIRNKTWVLVPSPEGRTTIGCKWVYKVKYNFDGTIAKYKAKLIAKGFLQQYEFDFT
uniref:Reverse transcriptase Ty1/copia-type domain-containing protein n=1 Tax=Cannabis sativa TaxID=3483 RepID=A0A803P8F4_CANSA